ncbi:MAG TPA: hypothetical protein VFX59_10480 [Polyangiales bacterium]|nr:hypothetical protein [Polyangiales bacterium]
MSLPRACIALVLLSACAQGRHDTLHSSANGTSYALRYPQLLAAARSVLSEDDKRAHAANASLAKVSQIKVAEPSLPQRVVDEANEAGTSESYARAYGSERDVAQLWDEERGPLAARTSAAAQKLLADGNCADKDLGPAVQGSLRDGLDKPLERRLRATNEAQRTLELHKARLAPGTLPAWQRAADEIALASHYAYVVLAEDTDRLQHLLDERSSVEATLVRAIDDERKIQTDPHAGEQKASQDRVVEIEKVRAAVAPEAEQAQKATAAARDQQRAAQDEYEAALKAIRDGLSRAPTSAAASSAAGAVKH